jgi:hypothetical protein
VAVRNVFTEKNEKGSCTHLSRIYKVLRIHSCLTTLTFVLDINSVWLFIKINWESFEYKFQPIEERFAHHALVIVRLAGVEALITNLEPSCTKQQETRGKLYFSLYSVSTITPTIPYLLLITQTSSFAPSNYNGTLTEL